MNPRVAIWAKSDNPPRMVGPAIGETPRVVWFEVRTDIGCLEWSRIGTPFTSPVGPTQDVNSDLVGSLSDGRFIASDARKSRVGAGLILTIGGTPRKGQLPKLGNQECPRFFPPRPSIHVPSTKIVRSRHTIASLAGKQIHVPSTTALKYRSAKSIVGVTVHRIAVQVRQRPCAAKTVVVIERFVPSTMRFWLMRSNPWTRLPEQST